MHVTVSGTRCTQLYNCHCLKPKSFEEMPQNPPCVSIAHVGAQRAETLRFSSFTNAGVQKNVPLFTEEWNSFYARAQYLPHKVKVCGGDNAFPRSPICKTCIK